MTAYETPPKTTSEIGGIRARTEVQSIDASYYYVTDTEGSPIAGLLVLLDSMGRPVRGELHLYDELDDRQREFAVRQARSLLRDHYEGRSPVTMRILQTYQERNAVEVALEPPSGRARPRRGPGRRPSWLPLAAGVGALVVLALAVYLITMWMGRDVETATATPEPAAAQEAAGETPQAAAGDAAPAATLVGEQRNDLPPSVRADNTLGVGQRVRVLPGYSTFLRTEPGATAGEALGTLSDGDEAQIVDGPVWMAGVSDTIVWWYVRADDGREGWTPANTSDLTLLAPVAE